MPPLEKKPKFAIWHWLVLLMAVLLISVVLSPGSRSAGPEEMGYNQFRDYVAKGAVEAVQLYPDRINFKLKQATADSLAKASGQAATPARRDRLTEIFGSAPAETGRVYTVTRIAEDKDLVTDLQAAGVKYRGMQDSNWGSTLLSYLFLPLMLVLMYVFLFRRMSPNANVLNIGKNKSVVYAVDDANRITFEDVAGLDEAKEEVHEVVDFLKDPKKFTKLGGKLPKGVLLIGPPGTGKTLLAKAVAGEAGVPFFSLSGSDFVEMFVGVGAARVRDLFRTAKEKAPCIIFIDEIDAIGRSRGKGAFAGANDERENTLNQLLVEMDGFNTDKGVIIMAATNRPDVLDSALLRPGRFDRQVLVDKPDLKGRIEIFGVHSRNMPLSPGVDLKVLAAQTPGFAGAEIANICNEAALLASRQNKSSIDTADFQEAIERVIAGLEKKNKLINSKERKIVAYHESGHTLVSYFLPHADPVLKVSIVPRGFGALGYMLSSPLEDRYLMTKPELEDRIAVTLGGRVAEEIVFGQVSTGAQNDLERITDMAYSMVTVYGMSDKVGQVSFADTKNQSFTGGAMLDKKYGSETARLIDAEAKAIIDKAYARAHQLVTERRNQLEALAQTLLVKEVVDAAGLLQLFGERPVLNDMNPDAVEEFEQAVEIAEEVVASEPTAKSHPDGHPLAPFPRVSGHSIEMPSAESGTSN